jgi:hypothetical protein
LADDLVKHRIVKGYSKGEVEKIADEILGNNLGINADRIISWKTNMYNALQTPLQIIKDK